MNTTVRRLLSKSTLGLIALLLVTPAAVGAPRDAERLKNQAERQAKDRLRHTEQQRRAEDTKREAREREQRQAAQENARSRVNPTSPQPFSAAAAPPPDECLKSFIIAARSATSMEQLMAYLPDSEEKMLRGQQATFQLQSVEERREYYRQRSPNLTEDQLASLTRSPYAVALQYCKSFADNVVDVADVKIVGDQAEVTVAIDSGSINGRPVGNGKGYVTMVGEGAFWKVKTHGSSPLSYKQRLTSP